MFLSTSALTALLVSRSRCLDTWLRWGQMWFDSRVHSVCSQLAGVSSAVPAGRVQYHVTSFSQATVAPEATGRSLTLEPIGLISYGSLTTLEEPARSQPFERRHRLGRICSTMQARCSYSGAHMHNQVLLSAGFRGT
jgi:hypothetical protein